MNTYRNQTRLVALGLLGLACFAQTNQTAAQDSLEVTFVGTRELHVRDAVKQGDYPQPVALDIVKTAATYTELPVVATLEPLPLEIKASRLQLDAPIPRLYPGYVRGGFGLHVTPLIGLQYGDMRSRKGSWNVQYNHLSSSGGAGLLEGLDDGFSHHDAGFWMRRFVGKKSVDGGLSWSRDAFGLYGLDTAFSDQADTARLRYQQLGMRITVANHLRDSSDIHFTATLRTDHLNSRAGAQNTIIGTDIHVHAYRDGDRRQLDFSMDYDQRMADSTVLTERALPSRALVGLQPAISRQRGNLNVLVGAGLWVDARGSQSFHFYPRLEARYSFFDDLFVPYAGISGGMERLTTLDLVEQNPYVQTRDQNMRHTNRALDFHGGIRGALARNLEFNAEVRTTTLRDRAYFVNDSLDGAAQRFTVAYDTVTVARVMGEIAFHGDDLDLSAKAEFFTYGLKGTEAWYLPRVKWTADARWAVTPEVSVTGSGSWIGQRTAPSFVAFDADLDSQDDLGHYSVELPGYVDLSIEAEYRYNKRLAVWGRAAGLTASQFARWNGYPVQPFQAILGLSYRF
jgi:hypothetical protein